MSLESIRNFCKITRARGLVAVLISGLAVGGCASKNLNHDSLGATGLDEGTLKGQKAGTDYASGALKKIQVSGEIRMTVDPSGDHNNPDSAGDGSAPEKVKTYTVKEGDNLWGIAREMGIPENEIRGWADQVRKLNGLDKRYTIQSGQKLKLPPTGDGGDQALQKPAPKTPQEPATKNLEKTGADETQGGTSAEKPQRLHSGKHKVGDGENLLSILKRIYPGFFKSPYNKLSAAEKETYNAYLGVNHLKNGAPRSLPNYLAKPADQEKLVAAMLDSRDLGYRIKTTTPAPAPTDYTNTGNAADLITDTGDIDTDPNQYRIGISSGAESVNLDLLVKNPNSDLFKQINLGIGDNRVSIGAAFGLEVNDKTEVGAFGSAGHDSNEDLSYGAGGFFANYKFTNDVGLKGYIGAKHTSGNKWEGDGDLESRTPKQTKILYGVQAGYEVVDGVQVLAGYENDGAIAGFVLGKEDAAQFHAQITGIGGDSGPAACAGFAVPFGGPSEPEKKANDRRNLPNGFSGFRKIADLDWKKEHRTPETTQIPLAMSLIGNTEGSVNSSNPPTMTINANRALTPTELAELLNPANYEATYIDSFGLSSEITINGVTRNGNEIAFSIPSGISGGTVEIKTPGGSSFEYTFE